MRQIPRRRGMLGPWGPGVFICNQCITLCVQVLDEDSQPRPPVPEGVWVKTSVQPRRRLIDRLRNLLRSRALLDTAGETD